MCTTGDLGPTPPQYANPLYHVLSSSADDYAPIAPFITHGDEERVFASSVPLPPDPSHNTQETTSSSPVRTPTSVLPPTRPDVDSDGLIDD